MALQDTVSESTKIKVHSMTACVKRWILSYRKTCNERTLTKMDTDIGKLITSEHVNTFERSEPALNAVKLTGIASANQSTSFTAQDYVLVRDYLLAEIVLSNASRTGVLSSITVKQARQARQVDQYLVVSVAKHKKAWLQGPAKIVLTKCMHSWLNISMTSIRSQFDNDDDTMPVFLTANGEPMESSQICRALQSIWQKAGSGNKITCSLVRKTAVTTVHQPAPEMSSNLADLMCHRVETANKCYRLVDREKTSVAAAAQLSTLLGTNEAGKCSERVAGGKSVRVRSKAVSSDDQVLELKQLFAEALQSGTLSMPSVKQSSSLLSVTHCQFLPVDRSMTIATSE